MKPFLLLSVLASMLALAGCAKESTILHVEVTDATYQHRKELKERLDLVTFEKLLGDRTPSPATNDDFLYVLAVQTPLKKEYWNYNADGSCVLLQDGKPLAFFRIKDPKAFNELIGIKKSL